jgi:GNAT superfamily N-acetyltransferase
MPYYPLDALTEDHVLQLCDFYSQEWWTADRTLDDVRTMIAGSAYVYAFGDEQSGRLAAFARVLSDGVFKALIFDLIVDPPHRGQGLGAELMKVILGDARLSRVKHFELYCLPELEPYYAGFGFSADVGGIRLMRRQS